MDPTTTITPNLDPTNQPSTATIPQQQVQGAPPAAMQPAPAQQQPQQPNPQVATAVHDSLIGRAFKAISGQNTQYQVDPSTGKMVQTQVPNTPGQFFRNVVASAIVGGAAGADNANSRSAGSGLAAGALGARAALNRDQQLDQERVQRAQQDYQNQLVSQRNQREEAEAQRQAQGFQTEETLRKANIAHANAETYRTNVLTQGEDFKTHQEVAEAGNTHFSDYKDAGLKPIAENVSEQEMNDFMKNRPGSSQLDWEATGVKVGKDAQGNPTHEYTYSAFDPKGQIPVSQGTLDQWKKDGMDKYYPDLFKNLKAGRELDVNAYVSLKKKDANLFNNNFARQKQELDLEEGQQRINTQKATAAHEYAETRHVNQEIFDSSLNKKQGEQFTAAMKSLDDAGGDISKLKPSERVTLGESAARLLPAYNTAIKNALDNDDHATANDLMGQMTNIMRATSGAFSAPKGPVAHPDVLNILNSVPGFKPEVAQQFANLSPDQIVTQTNSSKLPQDVKDKILKAVGKSGTVAPAKSIWDPNKGQWIRTAGSVLGQAVGNVGSILTTGQPLNPPNVAQ